MGKVSRNCTEEGWSEPFPHYVDVCFFYDNATKPVRPLSSYLDFLLRVPETHASKLSVSNNRICTTPQSRPCTQLATAHPWCLWQQPWSFSADSGGYRNVTSEVWFLKAATWHKTKVLFTDALFSYYDILTLNSEETITVGHAQTSTTQFKSFIQT